MALRSDFSPEAKGNEGQPYQTSLVLGAQGRVSCPAPVPPRKGLPHIEQPVWVPHEGDTAVTKHPGPSWVIHDLEKEASLLRGPQRGAGGRG